ncbi:MAG: hypothetical protein M0004_13670 [Actinomycetota bacterium]|nr:hypothetical protein [Actinomycetota bacterium]
MSVPTCPVRRIGLAGVLLAHLIAVAAAEFGVADWVAASCPPPIRSSYALAVQRARQSRCAYRCSCAPGVGDRLGRCERRLLRCRLAGGGGRLARRRLKIGALGTIDEVSRYGLPSDGVGRGGMCVLEPRSFITSRLGGSRSGDPLFVASPPRGYLVLVVVWCYLVMMAALIGFERRKL